MALEFDKIPSVVELVDKEEAERLACNVEEEILSRRKLLMARKTKCKIIKPFNRSFEKRDDAFLFKFICVCPQFNPCYPCKHTGNVIIDRDVLTRTEHICFLATPKSNMGATRKLPRFYHKRILLPFSSARIAQLAQPKKILVKSNVENFEDILSEDRINRLKGILEKNDAEVSPTSIETALAYINEEVRLKRVSRNVQKKRCRQLKRLILQKQKRQIKKIICVLFEELKDFLLNDQFLIDECSMLTRVILEKIREFTDKDFYSTSNLREYQKILANNIAVWINKFISAMSIFVTQPQPEEPVNTVQAPEPETFLPVFDYISLTEQEEEQDQEPCNTDFIQAVEESVQEVPSKDIEPIEIAEYDQNFI